MNAKRFDQTVGPDFFATLPQGPGVYEWLDAQGRTLYVGKARQLRNRLRQYRNATRQKAHRKMREVVKAASAVRVRPTESDVAALLLENELIQALRPPFNVAGAYAFLYPCIGVRLRGNDVDLCCTTSPDQFEGFAFSGAYRSPALTREAFAALVELLGHLGHPEPTRRLGDVPKVPFSRVARFRRLNPSWVPSLDAFLQGTSKGLLQQLVLALVDKPAARRHGKDTQALLSLIKRFWEQECEPLREALKAAGRAGDRFVAQAQRDPLFLSARGP